KLARILVRWSFALPVMALGAALVQPGDKLEEVYASVGKPKGRAAQGEREMLYYDRGEIELRDGVVTRVAFLSDDEFSEREARRVEAEERQRVANAEGAEIKAQRLTDASFQKASPAVQLAYWQDFARRYPGVSCVDEISLARAQLKEQRQAELIKEEKERLAAEEANRRAAPPVVYDSYGYGYGYGYAGYGYGYGGYGNGGHRGRYFDCVDPKPVHHAGNPGYGLFSGNPIVEPFSPTPIVQPFQPPPKPQFAKGSDIWPASTQNAGPGDFRDGRGAGSRRF
ncbi:MAG TPA: hypothetical protein VFJ90_01335, partial [Candidatus Didemnitutus sp.]|nr:hypothetical protein [Candidatus Didemnitutus sp.]